jgi:hypothetical protein
MRCGIELSGRIIDTGTNTARQNSVPIRRLSRHRKMRTRPLGLTSAADPLELAADEVVNLSESEGFELPRSPWAHVSGAIPAIDDDGASSIKLCRDLGSEPLEGDVDRVW